MRGMDAQRELAGLRAAIQIARLGVWDWDVASGRCGASTALLELVGLGAGAGRPSTLEDIRAWAHPDDRPRVESALRDHLSGRTPSHHSEYRALHGDGHWVWLEERARVVERHEDGTPRRVVGTCVDVTERIATLHGAAWLALHDPLTTLPNRTLFTRRLAQARADAAAGGPGYGVLLLDLDCFKQVNDRSGHLAGDRLLVQVAGRLRHSVRRSDVVGRLGGDEFAALIIGPRAGALATVADRIIGRLREPFVVAGASMVVSASGGLAVGPAQPGALLKRADVALYAAKAAGGACWHRHGPSPAAAPAGTG